jgi:LmbE family N-acetylglucosaminyl deacetylase
MNRIILVIAPHPDDEILGVGGTIAKFINDGNDIYVLICTKGYPPDFDIEVTEMGRKEARMAHEYLGIKETIFLDFPAANLDKIQHKEINKKIIEVLDYIKPQIVFIPFIGDIHLDHQIIFHSSLVALRPINSFKVERIYAYETLSETNWNASYVATNFIPNVYIDITNYLDKKIEAMKLYKSQLRNFPHERSLETIRALAMLRGSTVGVKAAEAFVLIREIILP